MSSHARRASIAGSPSALARLGAFVEPGGTRFALWSTRARDAEVRLFDAQGMKLSTTSMASRGDGLFDVFLPDVGPGALYCFVLDGEERPDPYARFLPHGVHGPARVGASVSASGRTFARTPPIEHLVVYEVHIGTFTPEGTYRAAQSKLWQLAELGVTAIEIMPVAAFDGARGWGYDGVALFAPFAPYGEPADLRSFVEAAHALGLFVLLDVVYGRFGPSGNYLPTYSPEYFTENRETAWGAAPDFSHPRLRQLVLENARYWLEEFGFDGLRLDATHGIVDASEPHVLQELAAMARAMTPRRILFAEDERNEPSLVTHQGIDSVRADDFHHAVRVTLTGEKDGQFAAYGGGAATLARVIERGWLFEGQVYPPSRKARGRPASTLPASAFTYCIQNHDHVGNRAMGTRLCADVELEAYCSASMLLLFLTMVPLLFMGQEWAASTPFLFFTDHGAALGEAITAGRRDGFKGFSAFASPESRDQIPDPQAPTTFAASRLDWEEREQPGHARVLALYRRMLALRIADQVRLHPSRASLRAESDGAVLVVTRRLGSEERVLVFNTGNEAVQRDFAGDEVLVESGPRIAGSLGAKSAVILKRRR